MGEKITSFEQLHVWQESQALAIEIYVVTKNFPNDELYAMTSQLRRAVTSISANIAEGFGRYTQKDKLHFYTMSYGSLLEVKNFLHLAVKLGYIDQESFQNLMSNCDVCQRLILGSKNALMK